ncbi:MAG: ABC transporter substrate-binding protein [Patescibacteria group bacterium]|nr:peptide ABC transporter substrate-binding protein [bacterium]HQC49911.1 peptide ABC transporter substrate-binding protein [bacterium]
MISLKDKISKFLVRTKQTLGLFLFSKSAGRFNQIDIDKKLVYSLSPRKIPSQKQLKYLPKFLSSKENLIIKICLIVLLANLIYLGIVFFNKKVETIPVAGGTYIEAMVGYPKTINPLYAISRDVDNDLSRLIYSSLFRYDSHGHLVTDLTNVYQILDGGKEYLIEIKDDVYWHNGKKLTSDDIVFTFNIIKDEKYRSPLRENFLGVTVEKIDERTVKFTLVELYAPFLEMLTFGILPKNIWETISADAAVLNDLNLKPIGSGPYKFKSLIKNKKGDLKEYHLEVNNDYYSEKPYIKSLVFKFFDGQVEAINSFNNGQLDGLSYVSVNNRADLIKKETTHIFELLKPQLTGIFFNKNNNSSLGEKEIRAALATAINKEEIVTEIFKGAGQVAHGPILKNSFAYKDDAISHYYNRDEAAATLADKELKIKLTVIDNNQNVNVANKIKDYWQAAGVTVEVEVISLEQAAEVIKNRQFEALLYGQQVGGDPDVYAFWHSTQTGARGLNFAGYSNEEVDILLQEARSSNVLEERITNYHKFQEIWGQDLPVIFLYSPAHTYVQAGRIHGFNGSAIVEQADRFSNIFDWYIKTKKRLNW